MAYVEVYNATWDDFGGIGHEIKLLQEGGSNVGQIDVLQTTPYSRSVSGGKKAQIENQIFGTEIRFNFVAASADIAAFDAILESDYKEWKIEHYYNSSLDFVGFLQPDNFSRDYVKLGDYYFISYSAVDGLANLKNIEFTDVSDGSQFDDRVTIMTTLKRALLHIGFELDFRVQLGTWCTNDSLMVFTDCALDKVTHDSRRFQKTKDGRLTNTNIYEVISELLEPFNCYLMQSQGQYWIINTREDNSFYFPIPWTTLIVGARTASDLKINITDVENLTNRGGFQKIRPLETVGATFRDRNVRDNSLTNGDFHIASTSEWVEGTGLALFATMPFGANNELAATIVIAQGIPSEPPNFHSVAQTIVVRGDADQIQVIFKARCANLTMDAGFGGSNFHEMFNLTCQIRKGTASGAIISTGSSEILLTKSDSAYRNYQFYFNISEDDDYFIEILINKTESIEWADYNTIAVRFDDFNIIAAYSTGEDITFDKYFKVSNADSSFIDFLDVETQFGDSTSSTDIGAFKISGSLTETWSRFGKSENTSINFLVAKNIIENFSKYKDYLRITIIDDTDRILPHTIIEINSSFYQIVSQNAKYKGGFRKELQVELMEILNAAVNVTIQEVGLSSVDGDGGSSSPFDDAVTNPGTNPSQPGLVGSLQQVTDVGNFTTNDISLKFGDWISEQNPDAVDAIRIKGTSSDVDVVIGHTSGYFSVWNVADNTAVFYVDNVGNTVITGSMDMNSHQINELTDPTLDQDAATKKYVDDLTDPSLLDNSMVDALHRHSELSASDGTPDRALVVDAIGQVGIGVIIPSAPLGVKALTGATAYQNGIRVNTNSDGITIRAALTVSNGDDAQLNLYDTNTDLKVILRADGDSYLIGGNIGIGTLFPQKDLHIESGVPTLRLSDDNAATDLAVATLIELYRGNNTNRVGFLGMESSSNNNLKISTDYAAGQITLGTGSNVTALTIDSSQRVGIGTAGPGQKLEVAGNIKVQDTILYPNPDDLGGGFGSLAIDGGATGGYEGFSIGGRAAFIHNNADRVGIWDDVNSDWLWYADMLSNSYMLAAGVIKIQTSATGGIITGRLEIKQIDVSLAQPSLAITQADVSEEMIEFITTIGTGNAIEVIGAKTYTTTHLIKVTLPGGLTRYMPCGTLV